MVTFFPRTKPAREVEDFLSGSTDGLTRWVAVELFDHPESRFDADLGADVGPWAAGPEAEVYEWLAGSEFEDYSEQYSAP